MKIYSTECLSVERFDLKETLSKIKTIKILDSYLYVKNNNILKLKINSQGEKR